MFADFEPKTHLLQFGRFGCFAVGLELLSALVVELTPIDYFYHWWLGVRRDFDEVEFSFAG